MLILELVCGGYGQSGNEIITLLSEGKMEKLEQLLITASGVEAEFLDALFESNGEKALQKFIGIWGRNPGHPLSWEAARQIYEYYCAVMDDSNASIWALILEEKPSSSIVESGLFNIRSEKFFIQTGAFSNKTNAERQMQKLIALGYEAIIDLKKSGAKNLYLVKEISISNEKDAQTKAKDISQKLKIKAKVYKDSG
jgi:hypothetical protein